MVGRDVNAGSIPGSTPHDSYTPRQLEILAAATRVFAQYGYRGGTIARIAAESGLSQAGLLHHFSDKDALLMAVIELRHQDNRDLFLPAIDRGEMVVDAVMSVLRANARDPGLIRLFAMLSTEALNPDHPAHQYFVEFVARELAEIADAAVVNQAAGLLRDDIAADDVARLIVAVADGARFQSLLAGGPIEHWRTLMLLRNTLAGPRCGPPPDWAVEQGHAST